MGQLDGDEALVVQAYETIRRAVALVERLERGSATTEEVATLRELVRLLDPRGSQLTEAEWEVARLAADGLSNAAIADRRGTTVRTVSKQLDSAYRKLGVSSRRELAVRLDNR